MHGRLQLKRIEAAARHNDGAVASQEASIEARIEAAVRHAERACGRISIPARNNDAMMRQAVVETIAMERSSAERMGVVELGSVLHKDHFTNILSKSRILCGAQVGTALRQHMHARKQAENISLS